MRVARWAAFAAWGLSASAALLGLVMGEVNLAMAAVPCLLIAALFWTLANIAERREDAAREINQERLTMAAGERFSVEAISGGEPADSCADRSEPKQTQGANRPGP